MLERMWREGNPGTRMMEMSIGTSIIKNSVTFPQKVKSLTTK